jgi:type I restriction enzyme S subunit
MPPKGWIQKKLSEISKEKISYGIVQAGPHIENGVPYIKSSDVKSRINVEDLQRTSNEIHYKYRRSAVHPGDIVFSLRGNIGECSIVPYDLPEANLTQGTARISVSDNNDSLYVYYQLKSKPTLNQINALSKGSTFREISLEALRKVHIPIPSKDEQSTIAKILSTWDKAIETIEKLIKNSKAQKKALMQRLLHKKVRLSGYSDYWVTYKLGDCCQICTGSKDLKDKQEDGRYPFFVRSKTIQKIDTYSFDGEAILIPGEGGVGEIIHYINGKFDYHQRVYKLSDFIGLDGRFLYYYLQEFFKREVNKNAVRATVDSLRLPIFKEMRVIAPPRLEEQQRIAQILNNLDDIIFKHEQQLIAARSTKNFLMQQLLTGKRRVKVSKTKAAKAVA